MTRAGLTPAVVVAEAAAVADELGFDAITVSAVARRLGVQSASLYAHVRDRGALLDGVTALAMAEIAARMAPAIAGRSGRDALRGYADSYRDYAREFPGRWAALQRRAGPAAVASTAAVDVVALTDAVLRGYAIPDTERVHVVRLLGATINGFVTLEQIGSLDHRAPAPEQSWDRAVDALDLLLRTWSALPAKDTPA
ncbi:WHG domain-containing protein [Cellulomonas sp. NPDC058312]|jgi:AcrR family transcriptional regulator|uniref:TetR/AcrR family transcriptional regulator n=1 Tax=Cellulomonas sp. NPDC058312 TaxID=3346441 RepID=UPI0036EC0B3E